MHGVHGIELIPELGKGYTSNGLDRTVTVFEPGTLQFRKLIRYTGVKPDAIQYDPDSRRLFVVNGGASGDVTIIDPATMRSSTRWILAAPSWNRSPSTVAAARL